MRLIRWAGENVSPSDDGRLYEKIFGDGLLADVDMTPAGAAKINIGPIYGIICGREFTTDAMTINAALPSSGTKYGTIYAEIDTSKSSPLSIKTSISQSWTPTRQDINVSGTVAQVAIGWYGATPTAVTQAESNWPIEGENGVLKRATVREVLERLYYMATNHQNTISGLTTEVTRLNNGLANIGDIVIGTPLMSDGDSIPAGWNNIAEITLPVGIWVLTGCVTFKTANSLLTICFSTRNAERSTVQTTVTNNVTVSLSAIVSITSERTVYLQGYGVDGPKAAGDPVAIFRAVRIK